MGVTPEKRAYALAALAAAGGGLALGTPLYLIGFLRKRAGWKIAAYVVLAAALLLAGNDLLAASQMADL